MAFSSSTFGGISAGVSDLFAASADEAKAQYDTSEQQEYGLASTLATQNQQIATMSTAIQQAQTEAGYTEQAASYSLMANTAGEAASAEKSAATGADIGAAIGFATGAFSLVGGGGGQNPTGPANSDGDQGMGGWAPAMPGL